jgi:hypothetical protein
MLDAAGLEVAGLEAAGLEAAGVLLLVWPDIERLSAARGAGRRVRNSGHQAAGR